MGYWEQIGVENKRHRERQARKPRWRRVAEQLVFGTIITVFALLLWMVQLSPLWRLFL